jgi:hypothetical protein
VFSGSLTFDLYVEIIAPSTIRMSDSRVTTLTAAIGNFIIGDYKITRHIKSVRRSGLIVRDACRFSRRFS